MVGCLDLDGSIQSRRGYSVDGEQGKGGGSTHALCLDYVLNRSLCNNPSSRAMLFVSLACVCCTSCKLPRFPPLCRSVPVPVCLSACLPVCLRAYHPFFFFFFFVCILLARERRERERERGLLSPLLSGRGASTFLLLPLPPWPGRPCSGNRIEFNMPSLLYIYQEGGGGGGGGLNKQLVAGTWLFRPISPPLSALRWTASSLPCSSLPLSVLLCVYSRPAIQ